MAQAEVSPTIEDYLSIIYILERDGEAIAGVRLASILGVTPPTVTNTLKRMIRDGLLQLADDHSLHLTSEGMQNARSIVRRHMLSEWMLSKMIAWSKLHDEAHMLEHGISDEVETALVKELGEPELCPHGNPLPGYESTVSEWICLMDVPKGEHVIVRRIHELAEETPELLSFLEKQGILPGAEVVTSEKLAFNQTIEIQLNDHVTSIGYSTARYIFVEIVH